MITHNCCWFPAVLRSVSFLFLDLNNYNIENCNCAWDHRMVTRWTRVHIALNSVQFPSSCRQKNCIWWARCAQTNVMLYDNAKNIQNLFWIINFLSSQHSLHLHSGIWLFHEIRFFGMPCKYYFHWDVVWNYPLHLCVSD